MLKGVNGNRSQRQVSGAGGFGFLPLEVKVIMIGAAGVEGGLANRAGVAAAQVAGDAEGAFAVATVNGFGVEFRPGPHNWQVVSGFFVAVNAGVECVAALESDGNDVALGVIVSALGAGVHAGAVAHC